MTEPSPKRTKTDTCTANDLENLLTRVKERFDKAGQDVLAQNIDAIADEDAKSNYLKTLDRIDLDGLKVKFDVAMAAEHDDSNSSNDGISPFTGKVGSSSDQTTVDNSYETGINAIRSGSVGAVLLAGGQGTRLGITGPKGMAGIGLKSGRTLFGLIAERLLKLRYLAGKVDDGYPSLPLYVMTSPMNHEETESFFVANNYFGLPKGDVVFFSQGVLPCVDDNMKILLETECKVSMGPDGNGGIFPALDASGCLDDMGKRGVEHLHIFGIDNALVRPADPAFVGYCISEKADCGNKVIWRAYASEKVGVLVTNDERPMVVEYSELSEEMASMKEGGKLKYGAANICSHYFTVDFIKNSVIGNASVPYHIARKKIPVWDPETKQTVKPEQNNGIKLETFIFDVFPLSKAMAVFEVERNDEFAPVKNANGADAKDCPDTARKLLSDLAKKWLVSEGAKLDGDADSVMNEIAPAITYAGEGLGVYRDKEVTCPFSLDV